MQTIPTSLAPFFQEYDITLLTPQKDAATIIERTLHYGSRAELKWLFDEFPRTVIREWVQKWGSFALPPPHFSFWRLLLEVE